MINTFLDFIYYHPVYKLLWDFLIFPDFQEKGYLIILIGIFLNIRIIRSAYKEMVKRGGVRSPKR